MVSQTLTAPREGARVDWRAMCFASLSALQLWLIFTHSPWWDEVQARLIAQQSLPEMFRSLHYEGHPALWYLILHALSAVIPAKMVLPLAQAPIALGVLALIWFRAPFSWPVKLLVCLGYFIVFEYGVIARSYGLGVLLFFGFVALRRSPWAWLLLALLVNVSLHTALLAGVCVLWLISEGRWSWRGAALFFAAGMLFLLTVWPAADVIPAQPMQPSPLVNLFIGSARAASLLMPVNPLDYPVRWQWEPEAQAAILIGFLPPIVGVLALRRRWRDAGLLVLFAAMLYLLPLVVYVTWPRHWGFLAVLFVGLLWGQAEDEIKPNLVACGWLGLMAVGGVAMILSALTQPFSLAPDVGRWITARSLEGKPWAAFTPLSGVDLTGELGIPTYNPVARCWQTFHVWNYRVKPKWGNFDMARWLNNYANDTGGGYVMSDRILWTMGNAQPLARFYSPLMGQRAYIYYVRPLKPAPQIVPNCR